MTMRPAIIIALLVLAAPAHVVAQEPTWFELYDQAIKHIEVGEYEQAEAKLLRAQKEGPASGRSVLRYGSLRPPYFPEYYLGIVYVSTGRYQEAIAQFQRARKSNINAREAEFRALVQFEAQAKAGKAPVQVPVPGPPPVVTPPVGPPPPSVDYSKQVADLLVTARSQLAQRAFDPAEQTATTARDLAIKHALSSERSQADALLREIAGGRYAAGVETALARRDAAAARSALNVLTAAVPEYRAETLRDRVDTLERELRSISLQRSAMQSFFGGNYTRAVELLDEAATVTPLTARGHFYRACSLAALAAQSPAPTRDPRLERAKQSYAAAAPGASQFRDDLRYISPKVRQLLGIQ
jgi:tetratricopeptide (TPR) repeat protein